MLGVSLLLASGVFVEGALRRSVSPVGAVVIAGLMGASVTVEHWSAVALAAGVFLFVITFSRLTSTKAVILAVSVSVFAGALGLASTSLVDSFAHVGPLGPRAAAAVVVSSCIVVAFGMAAAMLSGCSLLPFASVGAVALPVSYMPAAVVWAAAGLFFMARPGTRAAAAATVVIVAAAAAGAGLYLLPWSIELMEGSVV